MAKTWKASDTTNGKYLGILEFRTDEDDNADWHTFELIELDDRVLFGGMCNVGFIESGYILKDGFGTDQVLQELLQDLEVYYRDGGKYCSMIVYNDRM